jgi:DeoR family deoxyribose operon repressor
MEAQSRLDAILSILMINNSTTIKELTARFQVSEMTIRRDIELLEKAHMVRSYRGGVIVAERHTRANRSATYSLDQAGAEHTAEKKGIARLAASLIMPGDVVFLDSGSTVGYILDYLDPAMELTVICYSLNIFNLAVSHSHTQVIFSGGQYHPDSQCCDSPEGLALINRKRSSKAFISANGLHKDLGVTTPGQFDIPIKTAAIANCAHAYLVADSSKCGLVRPGHFADMTDFDTIISDTAFPEEMCSNFKEKGVEILLALPINPMETLGN